MDFALDLDLRDDYKNTLRKRKKTLARFLAGAARIILEGVHDIEKTIGHSVGLLKLLDFFVGLDTAFIKFNALNMLHHYGVFSNLRKVWIERLVEKLKETGYLYISSDFRPVLLCSEEAEELLCNPEELPLLPGEILFDPVLGTLSPYNDLEVKLRELRYRLARLIGRPSRQVFSDHLLRGICIKKPANREELEESLSQFARPHVDAIWKILSKENGEISTGLT